MRGVCVLVLAITAAAFPRGGRAQPTPPPGLEIVFLVDGSGSIDAADWGIQKTGIANALQDRASFPLDGSVAVAVVQWASSSEVELPYTRLDSEAALAAVVGRVQSMVQNGGGTSPHLGLNAGTALLGGAGDPGNAQVFCMSTDGTPSSQSALESSAANAESAGVDRYSVVAIEDPPSFSPTEAQQHYGPAVFGGGTVVTARNAAEFATLVAGACLGAAVELVGLEVNQSVQDWETSVPLVAGKPTIVRAHIESVDGSSVRAVGRLYGRRNGVELFGSPLLPLNRGGSVLAGSDAVARRDDPDATLNFALPRSWRSGQVSLRLELVGGGVVCSEAAPPANTCSADVEFVEVATPSVRLVEVIYENASGDLRTVTVAERDEQAARLESVLPIADLDYTIAELNQRFVEPTSESGREDFLADVNEALLSARSNDGRKDLYLGILKDSMPDAYGGLAADIEANAASWFLSGTEDREAYGYARNRGPHEVAHAVGERHAADGDGETYCSDDSAGSGAETYPYVENIGGDDYPVLGPLGDPDTEVWGVDSRFMLDDTNDDLAVVDPNTTFALMGYCPSTDSSSQGRWIDAFYLPRLIDDINAIDWSEGPVPDGGGGFWGFVRGVWPLDDANADVDFKPYFENRPGVLPTPMPTGSYAIELRDATGAVVERVAFEPAVFEADGSNSGTAPRRFAVFVVPVASPPEFASIAVIDSTQAVVGLRHRSAGPPTVAITSPAAGDVFFGERIDASWTASDPDGDDLTYTVQLSGDAGATWTTVAIDAPDTQISIERAEVAGSATARLRVIASDGTRSAMADSGTFSIANNAPSVFIRLPAAGQFFSGVQSVFMRASAVDAEDGSLAASSIAWSSDLNGPLGTGEEVVVLASDLAEGRHVITATATDSAGLATSRNVTIDVARVAPPPEDCSPSRACTFAATADSSIRRGGRNHNEGANELLMVRRSGVNRALVAFDAEDVAGKSFSRARLVLSIARPVEGGGSEGMAIDVHPLLEPFAEGNGRSREVPPNRRTRGEGEGVTWRCASDQDISTIRTDCTSRWDGGQVGSVADAVVHRVGDAGEVEWDVTADVRAGRSAWLVKLGDERRRGEVAYHSREGASSAGNLALGPRLILD